MDRDKAMSKELRELFDQGDENHTGFMTLSDLQRFMNDDKVKAHMRVIGIDAFQATGIFRLLDTDGNGHVEADEFIMGCMRLEGPAKEVDLATLLYESKKMLRYVRAAVHELKLDHARVEKEVRQVGEELLVQERRPKFSTGRSQVRLAMQDHIENF